jgi:hypothetical protein
VSPMTGSAGHRDVVEIVCNDGRVLSNIGELDRPSASLSGWRGLWVAAGVAVSFGVGIDLLWLSWAPPGALSGFWVWAAVVLIAASAAANSTEHIRAMVATWRLALSACLFVTVATGYWLVYPGAEFVLLAFAIGMAVGVWLLGLVIRIAIRARRQKVDAAVAVAVLAITIPVLVLVGFDPGRNLRLSMVRDRYEQAIAAGAEAVGNAAGISDGELAAWVWVDGHDAAVSGVVYSASGRLENEQVDSMMETQGYSIEASCHRLRPNWFWCNY